MEIRVRNAWVDELREGHLAWICVTQSSTAGGPLDVTIIPQLTATSNLLERTRLLGVVQTTKIAVGATGRVAIDGPVSKILTINAGTVLLKPLVPRVYNPRGASSAFFGEHHMPLFAVAGGTLSGGDVEGMVSGYVYLDRLNGGA
jgi:hypothetical protein